MSERQFEAAKPTELGMPDPDQVAAWLQHHAQDVETKAKRTKIHVFVMGPDPSADRPSARLRRELITRCKSTGGYSALAEHEEIAEKVKKEFGADSDLCFIEIFYARNVDLLVFIPDSPGSFAELGFFAGSQAGKGGTPFALRSIIFVDQQYEGQSNFICDGPVRFMHSLGADVSYVNYDQIDDVWEELSKKMLEAKRGKAFRKLSKSK